MEHDHEQIEQWMREIGLTWILENYEHELADAARAQRPPLQLLNRLFEGEAKAKFDRRVERRIMNARFPVVKTFETFQWNWPKNINRDLVRHLATLEFVDNKANAVFIGGVGLGKTHLATAIAYEACRKGRSVLFATAIDIINQLSIPDEPAGLVRRLRKYTTPDLLVIDELGYLPIGRKGADSLFQVISSRYERGSMIITTNRAYKDWTETFAGDAVTTSAVLDRILHHCETIVLEGRSYRMKDRIRD